jgi:SAM-dependent methyltransferase
VNSIPQRTIPVYQPPTSVLPPTPPDLIKILPEMINVPWQIRPYEGGGRSIEIPYIQRKLEGINNKKIADFGCLDGKRITTSVYKIDPNNEFYYFDIVDYQNPNYFKRDFTKDVIYDEESFDYGICVSVMEHIGLDTYKNTLNDDGDLIALRNILRTIKKDGTLYVTIPIAEKFYMPLSWIRSYTIKQIESWQKALNCTINIDTYQYIRDSWYSCPKDKVIGSYHYTGKYDIVAIACLEIRRNA